MRATVLRALARALTIAFLATAATYVALLLFLPQTPIPVAEVALPASTALGFVGGGLLSLREPKGKGASERVVDSDRG